MHEVLVNRLGGLSLPRKSVVRLTDRPDMTLDAYRGRKTTMHKQQILLSFPTRSHPRGRRHYKKREIPATINVFIMNDVSAEAVKTKDVFTAE